MWDRFFVYSLRYVVFKLTKEAVVLQQPLRFNRNQNLSCII